MLSLNQLPQAVHLQESTANSPTRLSLLYSSQFSSCRLFTALRVNMAVLLRSTGKTHCEVIAQVIKQIENKF